jgi:hypothetical protein
MKRSLHPEPDDGLRSMRKRLCVCVVKALTSRNLANPRQDEGRANFYGRSVRLS